ncbi:copper transporter [Serinibacter salmoneus]|uniref:Copper transport outer membrane protein MctB n=1 Tax=Serinibacter salmoneus TaxID=556530 RepID=A0A2A9D0I0_9MICO|nr:copper transporter [Serinibacter salmoneus]PFG19452.1 copper transport outer membrane protein MctB [Serinibacter salmoneus]
MIDFRYHVVSLISVLLALAVGIVLGAGPLQGAIADTLTVQVETLREERSQLRAEVEEAGVQLDRNATYIEATAPALLSDVMPQWRVAVVTLPGVAEDDLEGVTERIDEAGGRVTATVALTDMWADAGQGAFRAQLASRVGDDLTQQPQEAGDQVVLGYALAQALTEDAALAGAEEATAIRTAFTEGEEPLVANWASEEVADMVVVVTPLTTLAEDADDEQIAQTTARNESWRVVTAAVADRATTVATGYARSDADVLVAIRVAETVTTVDGLSSAVGRISVPLALAATQSGLDPQAYGYGIGATQDVPTVVRLDPPATVVLPDPADVDGGEPEDSATDVTDEPTDEESP